MDLPTAPSDLPEDLLDLKDVPATSERCEVQETSEDGVKTDAEPAPDEWTCFLERCLWSCWGTERRHHCDQGGC